MATTPTNKPIPSEDPRDLKFNAGKIDEEVNGSADHYTDRFGTQRLTNTGRNNLFHDAQTQRESDFQQFLLNSGYQFLGDYEDGPFQFSARNQYIRYDNQYYRLNAATDAGFTTTGTDATSFANDVTHFVLMDGDTLRQNLASTEEGMGASLVGLYPAGTVQGAIQYLTPEMFGAVGDGVTNDSAAFIAANAYTSTLGLPLYGFNKTYAVANALDLTGTEFKGLNFVPASGFAGGAPTFYPLATSGKVDIRQVSATGFIARGLRVRAGSYTGRPIVHIEDVECINNGALLRTTTTTTVSTSTDFVIALTSTTGFAVDDYVWVGDSKMRILTVDSLTQITLYNNGSSPTKYSGGTGTGTYAAGQYFTRDGDGRNGLTVGDGGETFALTISGKCKFNGNGWFGLFNWANTTPTGSQFIDIVKAEAMDNGYIGLGLGRQVAGRIHGCIVGRNGNNGIDINKASGGLTIGFCEAFSNGVDGIFTGSYSTSPSTVSNLVYSNFRIGILYSGDSSGSVGAVVSSNTVKDNPLFGICLTGVKSSKIIDNTLDGTCSQHVKVEGRDGSPNPSTDISRNIFVTSGSSQDILCVLGGYTSGGNAGKIKLSNNIHSLSKPLINVTSFDRVNSSFSPEFYVTATTTGTGAVGANIALSFTAFQASNTSLTDVTATLNHMQVANSVTGATTDTVTATRTAGLELSNTATTNGKLVTGYQFGTLSYNFNSASASTKYVHYNSGGNKSYVTLVWS